MEDRLLKLVGKRDYVPLTLAQLLQRLHVPPHEQASIQQALQRLEQSGQILRTKAGRYLKAQQADLIPGTIRINRQGKGFLQPDDPAVREITIPEHATGTALHGDRVLVRRDQRGARRGPELAEDTGAVVRILERKRNQIVGTLEQTRQFLYVIPDDPRIPHDVYVPPPRDVGRPARAGDKVVVELREWQSRHTNPEGEIVEVLGPADEEGVDMLSILRHYQLPLRFPSEVLEAANTITGRGGSEEASAADLEGRMDCRHQNVVTIDPDDAKDFDDAICIERLAKERWKLWVHIADVSHYVTPGSALDEEAQKRGNSTYLVDRVIPMLPEALSNGLCSLKPDVDRLTKCVEFVLSNEGAVLETRFYPAVIRSKRRFTYRQAFALLKRPPEDPISRMLHQANEMAQRIRRARFKHGSLALDFPERKIRLDAHGRVSHIETVENDISHQLIEEFMLLANEAVATRLMQQQIPAVYRIHEPPAPRRLQEFREEIIMHQIPCGNLTHRPEVQKLLQRLDSSPLGPALKIGFLRSLMRARYSTDPVGHYGLNKMKYTHFTSPIRRYADLLVHRALFDRTKLPTRTLSRIADHISETERNSDDAERDSKDVKLFAFLSSQLKSGQLQKYGALVIDVRNFGFFVDVSDLGLSGLVHLSTLEDDFFVFDPDRNQLVGRRTRRHIKVGDRLEVQVEKVDRFKKQVDFRLVKTGAHPKRHEREPGRKPSRGTRDKHAHGRPQRRHRNPRR